MSAVTRTHSARLSARLVPALLTGTVLGAAGCGGKASERPRVEVSAAELYAEPPLVRPALIAGGEAQSGGNPDSAASADLNFFDDLTTRGLASNDDAVHAALLLGVGRSAATYPDRVLLAQQAGLLEATYDRPGREAATIGEVSSLLVRVVDGPQRISQERAVARLVATRMLPFGAEPFQGLTGAQLITLVGGTSDLLRVQGRGLPGSNPPTPPTPITPPPLPEAATPPTPLPVPASVPAAAEAPRPEPMHDPAPTVAPFGEPAPPPPAPPPAPPAYEPGTPLRKPGTPGGPK